MSDKAPSSIPGVPGAPSKPGSVKAKRALAADQASADAPPEKDVSEQKP